MNFMIKNVLEIWSDPESFYICDTYLESLSDLPKVEVLCTSKTKIRI